LGGTPQLGVAGSRAWLDKKLVSAEIGLGSLLRFELPRTIPACATRTNQSP
jgi:hypothetical protein